jgi:hypothetical protein
MHDFYIVINIIAAAFWSRLSYEVSNGRKDSFKARAWFVFYQLWMVLSIVVAVLHFVKIWG